MEYNKTNFEHIVCLLSTGFSGVCGITAVDFKEEHYQRAYRQLLKEGFKDEDICKEEIYAKMLFNGDFLLLDDEDGNTNRLLLKDIEKQNIDWDDLECNGDFLDNNAILQTAIYGEVIYG